MIIDGKDQILGRMASVAAKKLLEGEEIYIVNAEEVIITGNRDYFFDLYKKRAQFKDIANPLRGSFFPKRSDRIVRRAVRGMLPWKKDKGRQAYKKLKVYVGIPEDLTGKEFVRFNEADVSKLRTKKYFRVKEISSFLGGRV
ncbi:MAG: 50S ribosomal protein L13 [Candidatus Methanofastidiosum sp.]|nr:50S ribosomal protein L13 [Methanofastidiosum sp.]